jgi:hypothetical protein
MVSLQQDPIWLLLCDASTLLCSGGSQDYFKNICTQAQWIRCCRL